MTAGASALTGTLGDLPLPELLGLLRGSAQSGLVSFTGPIQAQVALLEGEISIATTDGDPSLQRQLVATGAVASELLESAVAASSAGSDGYIATLIELGADASAVRRTLRDHNINTLFELLLAPDDNFAFTPGATHPAGDTFHFPSELLLTHAEQRCEAWATIASLIPSTALVVGAVPHLAEGKKTAQIDAADWPVLVALDGTRTISDMVRLLGLPAFTVCESLHKLLKKQLVEIVEPA